MWRRSLWLAASVPVVSYATSCATGSSFTPSTVSVADLEVSAADPALPTKAAAIYKKHGCVVVRGLNTPFVQDIQDQVVAVSQQSIDLERRGMGDRIDEGWVTPDGSLFIPAAWDSSSLVMNRDIPVAASMGQESIGKPQAEISEKNNAIPSCCYHADGSLREKQIMVLGLDYFTSSVLFQSRIVDVVEKIFQTGDDEAEAGSDAIELFGKGQLVLKEPGGGHQVNMHQDAAFFEFEGMGPVGTLNYAVDTNLTLGNGPLYVVPGSHLLGFVDHVDTSSHLGLDPKDWPVPSASDEAAKPVAVAVEGQAGDTIIFHQYLVHGSPPNHSDKPRPTFINRYTRPMDNVIMPLATSAKMRQEALEEAKRRPPARDRGYMIRGRREYTQADLDVHLQRQQWNLGNKHQHH